MLAERSVVRTVRRRPAAARVVNSLALRTHLQVDTCYCCTIDASRLRQTGVSLNNLVVKEAKRHARLRAEGGALSNAKVRKLVDVVGVSAASGARREV